MGATNIDKESNPLQVVKQESVEMFHTQLSELQEDSESDRRA